MANTLRELAFFIQKMNDFLVQRKYMLQNLVTYYVIWLKSVWIQCFWAALVPTQLRPQQPILQYLFPDEDY